MTAILRDGDRITIQTPGKLRAQVLRLYRNGVIAGYILNPRKKRKSKK